MIYQYRCLNCGTGFDEPVSFEEYRGEHFGIPAYETVYGCPFCHGDYEEIEEEDDEESEDDDDC